MSKRLSVLLAALSLAVACAKDPSKEATAAAVAEPVVAPAEPAPAAPAAAKETLTFTEEGSKIEWEGSKVTRSHLGSFQDFEGTIELDPRTLTASAVRVLVKTDSLVGDVEDLTNHLKSPDFFDVAQFPTAEFASTSITEGGGGGEGATHTITGNLTLHGVTKQVTFPATVTVDANRVATKAEFSINRKDFGLVYPGMPDDLIRDGVVIRLDIQAPRANGA